jgi:phosphonate transport system permease protein
MPESTAPLPPPRGPRLSPWAWAAVVLMAAFLLQGLSQAQVTPQRLGLGLTNLGQFLGQAFPPDFSRLGPLAGSMYETLLMAFVGVGFGVIFSLPVAVLSARNTSPHALVRTASRLIIAVFRTIPDLVWAMVFLVAVGFGPLAGILAIIADTMGFCARFLSERIEEIRPGPAEALASTGAGRTSVICGAILPEAFPSFVATSLYAVEKSVRAAVVLGLVGAGGIGVELRSAMNLFQYPQALTIILLILVVVIGCEQVSSFLRKRLI